MRAQWCGKHDGAMHEAERAAQDNMAYAHTAGGHGHEQNQAQGLKMGMTETHEQHEA
jgi:hypothetical protein